MTDNKKIYIEDFNNIRYNFMSDGVRSVDIHEHEKIKLYSDILSGILIKVKRLNEKCGA